MSSHSDHSGGVEGGAIIHDLGRELGFGLVGVAQAGPSDHAHAVRQWIANGRHGEMHYLAEHLDVRLDPRNLLEGARSVIAAADAYPSTAPPPHVAPEPSTPRGRIARYAWGDDYHKVIKKRLHRLADALREWFPDEQFQCVVDTAPALEREHAMRAGLGWTGKNTMMIHPRHGSFLLLGLIVSTVPIAALQQPGAWGRESDQPRSAPRPGAPPVNLRTDHCGTCTRCIDACPTGCITSDPQKYTGDPASAGASTVHRFIDATRCISYLTIEHRSVIEKQLHEPMGDWIAGCDVCQEVCPFNRESMIEDQQAGEKANGAPEKGTRSDQTAANVTPEKRSTSDEGTGKPTPPTALPIHPRYAPRREFAQGLALLDILDWTHEDRRRTFTGSALKRIKLDMLKRNALIALGNHLMHQKDPAARCRVEAIALDPDQPTVLQETARQVLSRLSSRQAGQETGPQDV